MYLQIVLGITRKLTLRVVRPLTLEAMFLLQPRRAFVSRYTWKASGPGRWAQLPDLLLPLQCTWLLHASLATVLLTPSSIIHTCHHLGTVSRLAEHVTSRVMWSHTHCQDTYAFHWLSAFRVLVFDQWLTRYVTRHVIADTLSRHTRISLAVSMVMEWRRRWHHCLSHDRRILSSFCHMIRGPFNCHCVSSPYIREWESVLGFFVAMRHAGKSFV